MKAPPRLPLPHGELHRPRRRTRGAVRLRGSARGCRRHRRAPALHGTVRRRHRLWCRGRRSTRVPVVPARETRADRGPRSVAGIPEPTQRPGGGSVRGGRGPRASGDGRGSQRGSRTSSCRILDGVPCPDRWPRTCPYVRRGDRAVWTFRPPTRT